MADHKLTVFKTVAETLSFSKTAQLLYVSQPAISKSISELENEFGLQLFERRGNKIRLSSHGKLIKIYADDILSKYKELHIAIAERKNSFPDLIKIGASTTIAQYVLPQLLAGFKRQNPKVKLQLTSGNTLEIERAAIAKEIDLGLIEGHSQSKQLKYQFFKKDELVVFAHRCNPVSQREQISIEELKQLPVVLREIGSGSLQVIEHLFKQSQIRIKDLNIEMHLGSTESIKAYMQYSHCLGIVSIHALQSELQRGDFKIIDVEGLALERNFYFVSPHGNQGAYIEKLSRFLNDNHNF